MKIKSKVAPEVWDFDGVLILNRRYGKDFARQLFREELARGEYDVSAFSDVTESIKKGLMLNQYFVKREIKDQEEYQEYWWSTEDDIDFKNNKKAVKVWILDLT